MNQNHVHQIVLEHLTGLTRVLPRLRSQMITGVSIAVAAAAILLASGLSEASYVSLAVGVIIAGLPVGVFAQRLTLRVSLAREQLRLQRFMIGKKGYIAPKSPVKNHDADLFSVATSLVCSEPHLSTNNSAAAWHSFTLTDSSSVAACSGWYGNDAQQSVFLYGDPKVVISNCMELWDLGHTRRLTDTDIENFSKTISAWKRIGLIPIALGYAPLPDDSDPMNVELHKLRPHASLLGIIGVSGSRGLGDTYSLNSSQNAESAMHLSLVICVTIAALSVGSVIANRIFNLPIGVTLGQIIALKLFVEPILLSSLSWDGHRKLSGPTVGLTRTSIKAGLVLAAISYLGLIGYEFTRNTTEITRLQAASALSILILGLCLLAYTWWTRQRAENPLFVLALASGLLGVLIIAYATGPLLITELIIGIGISVAFLLMLELYSYSERHHSRQYILDLLKTNISK